MSDWQQTLACPTCGNTSPAGASFCGNCGSSLISAVPRPDAPGSISVSESRNWAMGAHLTALAGALMGGVASFVGPLIIWLIRKDSGDAFATAHAKEALNFNLTTLLVVVVGWILALVLVGFIVLIVFGVLWLVWTIQASVAASRGEAYRYPLAIRFVS